MDTFGIALIIILPLFSILTIYVIVFEGIIPFIIRKIDAREFKRNIRSCLKNTRNY